MKIRPAGAELLYAEGRKEGWTDGWTDMTKLIVAFRNFENAPRKVGILVCLSVWNTDNSKLIICHFAYLISCMFSCHRQHLWHNSSAVLVYNAYGNECYSTLYKLHVLNFVRQKVNKSQNSLIYCERNLERVWKHFIIQFHTFCSASHITKEIRSRIMRKVGM